MHPGSHGRSSRIPAINAGLRVKSQGRGGRSRTPRAHASSHDQPPSIFPDTREGKPCSATFPISTFIFPEQRSSGTPHPQPTTPIITSAHKHPDGQLMSSKSISGLLWRRIAQRSNFLPRDQILPLGRTARMGWEPNTKTRGISHFLVWTLKKTGGNVPPSSALCFSFTLARTDNS